MNSTMKGEVKLQLEGNFPDDPGPAGLHLTSGCSQTSGEAREVFRSVLKIRKHIRQAECEWKRLRALAGLWSEGFEESATIFRASISQIGLQLNEQEKLFRDLHGKLFMSTGFKEPVRLDDHPTGQLITKSRAAGSGLERFCLEKLVETSEKSLLKNFLYCLDEKNKKLMDFGHEKERVRDPIYENLGSSHHQRESWSCDACSAYLLKIHQLEGEKKKLREAMLALRKEGKLLKADNIELLDQLKSLHNTLELKENEIRDFIVNFGIRAKESEITTKALRSENERLLKELVVAKRQRFQASKPAALNSQDSGEVINCRNSARSSIHQVDSSISRSAPNEESRLSEDFSYLPPNSIEAETAPNRLAEAPGEAVQGPKHISTARLGVRGNRPKIASSEEFSGPQSKDLIKTQSPPSSSGSSSSNNESQYLSLANPDCALPPTCSTRTSTSPSKTGQPVDDKHCDEHDFVFSPSNSALAGNGGATRSSTRRKTLSKTLSKIFGKDKRCADTSFEDFFNPVESNMATKWQRWDVVRTTAFSSWTPQDVMIWLELECCVPAVRLARCHENIEGGQALKNQTDTELAAIIGLTKPLHKLKLRLALEERKDLMRPASHLLQLDHRWVAHKWLQDLGLVQYSSMFEENLVDGRMLNKLSKNSLEKYLQVTKKQHQASIFRGVDLLRMLKFDEEALKIRRRNCLTSDIDLLVWSNERVSNWIRSIDLKDYADNLSESGVHGALMVLDSSFNADTLAQALQLPSGDLVLHNHLKKKLDNLLAASRRHISPSLLSKGSTKGRFIRTFSFRTSRESPNHTGPGSFKLQRKTPVCANSCSAEEVLIS